MLRVGWASIATWLGELPEMEILHAAPPPPRLLVRPWKIFGASLRPGNAWQNSKRAVALVIGILNGLFLS